MTVGGEIPVDNSAAVEIAAVFGVLKHVNCWRMLQNGAFKTFK